MRIPDDVGIGARTHPVGYPRVVQSRNAVGAAAVNHTERRARLKGRDARQFPAIQERMRQLSVGLWHGDTLLGFRTLRGAISVKPEPQFTDDRIKFVEIAQ